MVSAKTPWPTVSIPLIRPRNNYAAWERVAAELTAAASGPGAHFSRRYPNLSHHAQHPRPPPQKASPSSTHAFLGCGARKSLHAHAVAARRAREQVKERQARPVSRTVFVASESETMVKPLPTKGGLC